MSDVAELEARIGLLEEGCRELRKMRDVEAIKRVKYKYFRCLDSKLWDELGSVLLRMRRQIGPAESGNSRVWMQLCSSCRRLCVTIVSACIRDTTLRLN
jgi:hypothetical protein